MQEKNLEEKIESNLNEEKKDINEENKDEELENKKEEEYNKENLGEKIDEEKEKVEEKEEKEKIEEKEEKIESPEENPQGKEEIKDENIEENNEENKEEEINANNEDENKEEDEKNIDEEKNEGTEKIEEIQYKDEWEYSDASFDENYNNENNEENGEENLEEMNEEENEENKIETLTNESEQTKKTEEITKVMINSEEIPLYEEIQTPKEEELNKGTENHNVQEENKSEKPEKNPEKQISESNQSELNENQSKEKETNDKNSEEVKPDNNNTNDIKTPEQEDKSSIPNQINDNTAKEVKNPNENKLDIIDLKTPSQEGEQKTENNKKPVKKKIVQDLGFEILDTFEEDIQPCSTMNTSIDSSFPETILESINYESYLKELNTSGKKEIPQETFCSGFFIASFPKKNGQVIENLSKFPASCGHKDCSELPPMKPEIIYRYPLKDNKNLELNNLSATICFPAGIKMCYSEKENPKQIKDYVAQITNQKGERYYMRTFHFYKKMSNIDFTKEYEVTPLKHHLSKFGDDYLLLKEEEFTDEIVSGIQKNLEFCQELGFRDIVYIPCCICLISKYPYTAELGKCLETIYCIIGAKPGLLNFEINDLIMYLINSIPIPEKNTKIQFYIPYCNNPKIELQCPKLDDISTMNSNIMGLFKYFSVDSIVYIFRLLLSEKKILFIHNDYTELTNITNSFISLLYPFQWIHTYIPIMSAQMLKYLETFLPFLSGIHVSLMNLVEKVFKEGENEESEDIILIYIKTDEIILSSNFKKNKIKFSKYIQNNIPNLPFEKELKKELKNIESNKKQPKSDILENRLRDAFINIFVKMFHDFEKYIVNLDNDVVFNKVLFMKNLSNKEEKNEQFYNEFIDSQLFQQFTQNYLNTENIYFKRKIKEFKEKENKSIKRSENMKTVLNAINNKKEITYLAVPYIGFKNLDKNNFENINENYKITENETMEIKNKILENDFNIESDKYINSKCYIYLNPDRKESSKEEENKNKKTEIKSGEMTEKQIDQMKDNIKDIVANIFKSEIKKTQIKDLKKKIFSHLDTPAGKTFFISMIFNNNNNVISLQNDSSLFLGVLIRGILNSALKMEETDQLIEEIAKLIISSKYFETEIENNSKVKENITIFAQMKKFLKNYIKITQKNLWEKWYELEFERKKKECSDEDMIKEEIILDICKNMIFLQISKSSVKNVTEHINKIAFNEGSSLYEKIKKEYINLIIKANYISEANKN